MLPASETLFGLTDAFAGFDYNFNAIQNETNELFNAYKDMFEIVISQGSGLATAILIYAPWLYKFFVRGPIFLVKDLADILASPLEYLRLSTGAKRSLDGSQVTSSRKRNGRLKKD